MSDILKILLKKIQQNQVKIDKFFKDKLQNPLFYNSVDLRHSGFKIAPVDVNCFPAGFNNLSSFSKEGAKKVVQRFFDQNFSQVKKVLILPENHTRNLLYLQNIAALKEIISGNGKREVRIGSLITEIDSSLTINLENDNSQEITLEKIINDNNKIVTKDGFCPDLIIANNDFTDGPNPILQNITQTIIPSTKLGWYVRKKSTHFDIYNKIVSEFCQLIDIDPWLISTMHRNCNDINFKEQKGVECLARYVDELIANLKQKYQEYGIKSEPYCYIKADNGTYGMAIMTVKSGDEILDINKKDRNKMNVIKGSVQNTSAIIQEGVPTKDLIKNMIAEPMIYLVGGDVVGYLFRMNNERDVNISLNSSGMSFDDLNNLEDRDLNLGLKKADVVIIYSVLAKLSAISASIEHY